MKKLYTLCLLLCLLSAGCASPSGAQSTEAPPAASETAAPEAPSVGISLSDQAPEVAFQMLDGTTTMLSDYQGQPVIINFWATWCGLCVEGLPEFQALYEDYGDQVAILCVSIDNSAETVAAFLAEKGYTLPVAMDLDQTLSYTFQIQSIPQQILIRKDGTIYNRVAGKGGAGALENMAKALLAE